ncbi:unnamed protein product [Triticum turgidum subsp. durum]|uniref:Carboxypeptidase n=1 Tax=Triticum turgidum subsp. durum TaxID=4567 RepID=A0A9R0WP85_TRITD|nr:unnamed protein product [Triticum turgidum subsp. durum]
MTGGPFCSGMIFFEVGPMKFVLAPYNGSLPQLTYNPYSWSKTASITLLDSPVGTGFSYARDVKGYHDIGDFSFSMHVVIFLNKWFTDHPHYQSNPFFVGGSSYAGKMSPIIAQHISQEIELGKQPRINLKASKLPKKGFPPLCIQSNQPNHTGIGAGAEAAQSRPKETTEKEQKKQMPTTADQQKRRSLAIARPTELIH